QCHRFELDWGNFGALGGRGGRHDRVALVSGSKADGETRADVDWHTVNWSAQFIRGDLQRLRQGQDPASLAERIGQHPFQLVAFKTPVRAIFMGPAERNDLVDVRSIDRLIKYP